MRLEKLGVESSLVQNAVEGLMYVLLEASKRSVCSLIIFFVILRSISLCILPNRSLVLQILVKNS